VTDVGASDRLFDPGLRAAWEDEGFCVVEGAIPADDLAAAQRVLPRMWPSAAEMDAGVDTERTRPWRDWDAAWPQFPFKSTSVNRLVVHDVVVALARTLLGCHDVRLYLALMTAKFAGQSSGYNRLLHTDYPNHSVVVPRRDVGYQHLETFIYLTDVTEATGATRLVSRRYTAGVPVEEHTLNLTDHGDVYARDVAAVAPAGSIVAYRPDVYHRSVDITEPGSARIMLHVAYKPAAAEWVNYHSWAVKGFSPEWHTFVSRASPAQLAVLGFPPPGHPYWTVETLAGVAGRYPHLDMTPWTAAAG
jgi:ectoine hydroxylase-related dioxygenase (phytanoyl-CoA dioxygenase family)